MSSYPATARTISDPEESRWGRRIAKWKQDLAFIRSRSQLIIQIVRHPATPWSAKIIAGCAVAYILSPIQLIPNVIPVIGQLDDLAVLLLALKVIRLITPAKVLSECEARPSEQCSSAARAWPVVAGKNQGVSCNIGLTTTPIDDITQPPGVLKSDDLNLLVLVDGELACRDQRTRTLTFGLTDV